jgi:hypothetical protein
MHTNTQVPADLLKSSQNMEITAQLSPYKKKEKEKENLSSL